MLFVHWTSCKTEMCHLARGLLSDWGGGCGSLVVGSKGVGLNHWKGVWYDLS